MLGNSFDGPLKNRVLVPELRAAEASMAPEVWCQLSEKMMFIVPVACLYVIRTRNLDMIAGKGFWIGF